MAEFTTDIFAQFDKKWALITAGNMESFNMMTISWGGMGTLWGKPVVTVYVKPCRYTYGYMNDNEYFTVSFYPDLYKKELGVLGSKSGRDMDKMNGSGLTAVKAGESMTFKEAEVTLVCKKLFRQRLLPENMPRDVVDTMYADNDLHDMYIGEVVDIIK
jgi:flavin reductase (DIM6/NTAB) family NADH-FMN oxidoreductase RutF